ncbi:hypothetical protein HUO13_33510 [Saccharopolyspora erythraea]|uniref:hypothetical protein n=1 Tax=Saccharopolyspora erythraea TaxID=1836 RepID=UPI001BA6183C|nr:hypothetical protein [Saccharopolyspora erythraea]QUH05043.1 hypothetical protein HUO13_33510 [Saccharopolyspora erythraea]
MRRALSAAFISGLSLAGALVMGTAHAQESVTMDDCFAGGGGVAVDLLSHQTKCFGGLHHAATIID